MRKNEHILTFELSEDGDELDIHCDEQGLNMLIQSLHRLSNANQHEHLLSPSWGGSQLSEEKQSEQSKLINKITFHRW